MIAVIFSLAFAAIWICSFNQPGQAQESPGYVGTERCAACHSAISKEWALTIHRRTLFNEDPSRKGCESCHGPGGPHVAAGGDPTKIIRLNRLKPKEADEICLKCHTNEDVTLWQTSLHSQTKVSCTSCHNPHNPDEKTLLKDIDSAKLSLEGLTRSIKQAELAANTEEKGSPEKEEAVQRVEQLRGEKEKLQSELKGIETVYERTAEPYMCFNCHKTQRIQSRLPSHHPVTEGKMKCSSCHNPHGGPKGMLRAESVAETCYKCHAEKLGPFTFEHPPVTEDCTTCHNPHGTVHNNLQMQNQPFLCLKCHAGPHSRGNSLGNPSGFARFYTECTDCHNQIHGSDNHQAFHF